ncbi:GAF domain-containing protein [Egbenema bharatensis]|uniref:GAF domain-containing protein n=1 Tax=Egbenema bharatensis TaxID=3463334 RepID=UPI003A871701
MGVWIAHDPQCRSISANRTAYEFMRMEPGADAVSAIPVEHTYPFPFRLRRNGQDIPTEELSMKKAGRTGEPVEEEAELVFEDGFVRHIYGKAVPLRDEQNQVRGVIGAYVDVSDRKRAEERIRKQAIHSQILAEISQAFSETILDFQSVLETTAQYTANLIGDGCLIRLLSNDRQWLNLAAAHHRNPEALALIEELVEAQQPVNEGVYARVFDMGEPLSVSITSPEELQSHLPSNAAIPYLEQVGIASFVVAPLCVRNRAVGTLAMFRDRGGKTIRWKTRTFCRVWPIALPWGLIMPGSTRNPSEPIASKMNFWPCSPTNCDRPSTPFWDGPNSSVRASLIQKPPPAPCKPLSGMPGCKPS